MITFGLTGGIASGKSTATRTFRSHGIPMVDADIVARQVVEPGTEGLSLITETFGKEYLTPEGTLDRAALGRLVFSDKKALDKINELMMPIINKESTRQINQLHVEGHLIVGYDAALIIEMGNADKYRPLIVVACPRDTQIQRLCARNGLTAAEAVARIEAQISTERRIQMADYVIDTSGTIENSILQTKKIIQELRKGLGRFCFDCGREFHPNDKATMCEGCGFENAK